MAQSPAKAQSPHEAQSPSNHSTKRPSLSQSETFHIESSTSSDEDEEELKASFTTLILDLDDTMIPTTIRRCLKNNFSIDIFKLKNNNKETLLRELQLNIANALEAIRNHFDNQIEIALVTNGSPSWVKQMFAIQTDAELDEDLIAQITGKRIKKEKNEKPLLNILSKYFKRNNIMIHSTTRVMKDQNKGKGKHKWQIKYKVVRNIVQKKTKLNKLPCKHIISFGDGKYEKEAMNKYASQFNVQCIHFAFIKAPTIDQLIQQWLLLKNKTSNVLSLTKDNFAVFEMDKIFANDNTEDCTGKSHQLPSIGSYFQFWAKCQNVKDGKKAKYSTKSKLNDLASKINSTKTDMERNENYKESNFEALLNLFCTVHPPLKKAVQSVAFDDSF